MQTSVIFFTLFALFFTTPIIVSSQHYHYHHRYHKHTTTRNDADFFEYSYNYDNDEGFEKNGKLNAIAHGALIGATTGIACVYSDRAPFPLFPLNWLVCIWLRTLLVDAACDKLLANNTEQRTISTTAWLTDWLAYILLKFRR